MKETDQTTTPTQPPGFFRRMGAIFYDSLLLVAVLFLATALVLPFSKGTAFSPGSSLYSFYLIFISYLFFIWFWTRGGQTLGMRAWKIKVCDQAGNRLNLTQATVRFLLSIASWGLLGLGFLWIPFNKKRNGWHDLLSKTRIDWAQKK